MKRIKIKYVWLATFLILFSVLGLMGISNWGRSAERETETETDKPKNNYAIFAVKIPEKLDFAGENVPVDQIDVRESLDRELLVNTYWQSQTLLFIKRANRYFPIIEPILKKHGVPDDFKFLPVAESGLMNVISPANAVGFWQLLDGTGKEYGLEINSEVDERYSLEKATEAACRYLKESHNKYGSWTMAAASYNAGRRGMDRQVERQNEADYYNLLLNEETARYLFRILSYKLILSDPSYYGFHVGENDFYPEIPFYEVTVDSKVEDFSIFAKRYGINYKILKWLNPWLREASLKNTTGKSYYIKIPREGLFDPSRVDIMHKSEEEQGIEKQE